MRAVIVKLYICVDFLLICRLRRSSSVFFILLRRDEKSTFPPGEGTRLRR